MLCNTARQRLAVFFLQNYKTALVTLARAVPQSMYHTRECGIHFWGGRSALQNGLDF